MDLTLVNIDGLITNKRNKSHFLRVNTNATQTNSIVAITETWTRPGDHYNAEILKQFPYYSIIRADRDLTYAPDYPNRLKSTIIHKNNGTNGKICAKVAFPRYTESVKFKSQSLETASKRKPYRGLGTR